LVSARNFCKELSENNSNDLNLFLINESQVAAKFDFESRLNGAIKLSYPSVVAGGPRATFIHYGSCNKFMKQEDWILMDAGCEDMEGYVSDITRCWMIAGQENIQVSSSQSRLQAALYEALCEVQHHLMNHLKSSLPQSSSESLSLSSVRDIEDLNKMSNSISLDQLFQVMCVLLGKVLIEFGVIPKSSSTSESARLAYKFCPHHVSHFLGLDVHDTPSIPRSISLKPGMCFTLEPGLYFKESDDVKREFKGIGLRVEDDLLIDPITSQLEVLTKECPW
jgi:Xaa-Pro aminopeptidase